MRRLLVVPCLLLLGLAFAIPSASHGQRARQSGIAGTYRYAGSPEQGQMIVAQAVEPVLAMMRPNMQQLARERIAESTWLPTTIRIRAPRGRVEVALTGAERRTFQSPIGSPVQVPMRRPGEYAQLTQILRSDGALQQDFVAIDGVQQNIYVPVENGAMVLDVTLRSPALPSEIHFQLEYQRSR
jgi:hypothetical protein